MGKKQEIGKRGKWSYGVNNAYREIMNGMKMIWEMYQREMFFSYLLT